MDPNDHGYGEAVLLPGLLQLQLLDVVLYLSHHVVQVGVLGLQPLHLPHDLGDLIIRRRALLLPLGVIPLQLPQDALRLLQGVLRAGGSSPGR